MNVSGYNFPHPILGKPGDYTVAPSLTSKYEFLEPGDLHKFTFSVNLTDDLLIFYLNNKKAVLVCEINCSHTFYRRIHQSFKPEFEIEVPYNELRKKVDFQLFLIANEKIEKFRSQNFSEKYPDVSFNLDKGELLAILEQQVLNVDMGEGHVRDIILITEHEEQDYYGVRYYLNNDCIQVQLHRNQMELLRHIHNNEEFSDIIISSILIPAFGHACAHLNPEYENTFGERLWFETLKERAMDFYGDEYLDHSVIPEFVDKLLSFPNTRLLNSLIKLQNPHHA